MKRYYRVRLGQGGKHAAECFADRSIGVGYGIEEDLTGKLPEKWQEFNKMFIPLYLKNSPSKTKIAAALACGAVWTVAKGMLRGDIVLSPGADGLYRFGEIETDYFYAPGQPLLHRRGVGWLDFETPPSEMSQELRLSIGGPNAVGAVTHHQAEIEQLLAPGPRVVVAGGPYVEDPVAFAMEKHLEEFLVRNWNQTSLSTEYSIYEEDGEPVGQQFPTDAGPIDILALSKDGKRLLIIELKKGRASDRVVGQVLRYMGFVKDQIAEEDQTVEGAIVALDDDPQLRWALIAAPSISFYRYEISFELTKMEG
jgi:restriction system protein